MRALKTLFAGLVLAAFAAGASAEVTIITSQAPKCTPNAADNPDIPKIKPSLPAGREELAAGHYLRAAAHFRPLAEDGKPEAQRLLGIILMREGCNVPTNKAEGVEWLRKAAEHRDVDAQFLYAQALLHGNGVAEDDNAAVEWARKAAKTGDSRAQALLGYIYFAGRGVKADTHEALAWAVKAGEQGAPVALSNIAKSYLSGNGVRKDTRRAMFFIATAIQRVPPGQYQLSSRLQRTRYAIARQLSVEDVRTIEKDAEKWSPGKGSLADVTADADKWSPGEAPAVVDVADQ